jgi:hypothetical protein
MWFAFRTLPYGQRQRPNHDFFNPGDPEFGAPMKTNLPITLLCGLLLSLMGLPSRTATELALAEDQQEEKSISVEVASGRTFSGQLDARTDPAQLWLRSRRGSAVLLRPIQWERVVRVRVADRDLSGEQLRQIVKTVKPEAPAPNTTAAGPNSITIKGAADSRRFLSVTDTAPRKPPETPRVRALAIEAAVANWDADVEVDGLLVHIYPLDDSGAVVPVRGMVQFDLTGQREGVFRRQQPFATLGQWSYPVHVEDFGLQGAVYRLPFQGVHPEFDLTVAPHGALHARLSVPGQGTFEATESMLRIRPYSAVRDELQLSTGRRFFPQERTSRGGR